MLPKKWKVLLFLLNCSDKMVRPQKLNVVLFFLVGSIATAGSFLLPPAIKAAQVAAPDSYPGFYAESIMPETEEETETETETKTKLSSKTTSKIKPETTKKQKVVNNSKYKVKNDKEDPKANKPKTPVEEEIKDSIVLPPTTKPSTTKPSTTKPSTKPPTTKPTTAKPDGSTTTTKPPTTNPPPKNGWYTSGGSVYLYNNGKPVTGLQTLNGRKYSFSTKGVLVSQVGIDVSYHNGVIDWKKVKADGIDFAIIRVGYRGWGSAGSLRIDEQFANNVKKAKSAGVPFGVYFYTQAITTKEAIAEANLVLDALSDMGIKPSNLAFPVIYDIEDAAQSGARTNGLTNKQRTDFCIAFCDTIKAAGYQPMIYANKYWLTSKLNTGTLEQKYPIWLAHYTNSTDYKGNYKMWQYTEKGKVKGINTNVDLNIYFNKK